MYASRLSSTKFAIALKTDLPSYILIKAPTIYSLGLEKSTSGS